MRRMVLIAHFAMLGLLIIDILLLLTSEIGFRGNYTDRIIFWMLFLTGGILFYFNRYNKGLSKKVYYGFYVFYPIVALGTYLIDKILFVLVASPILISILIPDTYYKDNKYEIRSMSGLMAPRQVVLIEKGILTEKSIGSAEYTDEKHLEIQAIEISDFSDSILVKAISNDTTTFLTFLK